MVFKTLKSDFSLDGVTYTMNLASVGDNSLRTVGVEILTGPNRLEMVKIIRDGSPPEFSISGEGPQLMDERQCKLFLDTWISNVLLRTQSEDNDDVNEDEIMSAIENFFVLFNQYFGDKIAELFAKEENDDAMDVLKPVSDQPNASVSEDGCNADGKNDASAHANHCSVPWLLNNDDAMKILKSASDQPNANASVSEDGSNADGKNVASAHANMETRLHNIDASEDDDEWMTEEEIWLQFCINLRRR